MDTQARFDRAYKRAAALGLQGAEPIAYFIVCELGHLKSHGFTKDAQESLIREQKRRAK